MDGRQLAFAAAAALIAATPAAAQEKSLAIELNRTVDSGAGCRLTFVANNATGVLLEKTSFEVAVFDAEKRVSRLLIFEFGRLPEGKTRVVEFDYPSLACNAISRILVNTSPECVANGAPSQVCLDQLKTSSLTPIAFDQ